MEKSRRLGYSSIYEQKNLPQKLSPYFIHYLNSLVREIRHLQRHVPVEVSCTSSKYAKAD